jgi:hypothetical protein
MMHSHPPILEEYRLEMGMYGNIHLEPADADYWPPAKRELLISVDVAEQRAAWSRFGM